VVAASSRRALGWIRPSCWHTAFWGSSPLVDALASLGPVWAGGRWGSAAPAGCLSKEARRFTRKSLWPAERVGAGPSFSWGRRRPCRVSVYYVTVAPRCAFPSHPSHASPLCCWIRPFPCLPGPAWLSSPTHPQLARAVGPFRFIISVADLFAQSPNVVGGASAWYVAS
jgi:hypothetical protein